VKPQQVATNAKLTVAQVVTSAVVMLFLYRYLIRVIGIEAVGVWSVVLATTSAGRFADFGVTGSTTRFVARALGQNAPSAAAEYAQTAAISAAGIYLGLAVLAYPILRKILELVVPVSHVEQATLLLPYALFSFWLASVTTVFQGAIDGTHRIDLKSWLMIGSSLLYFVAALALVPRAGLMGLAWAQLAQSVALFVSSWLLLRRCLSGVPLVPARWRSSVFREIIGFGSKLQVISFTALLFEPTTKALLSKFGGLAAAGYYEMATRMVQQVRSILVSANQVLVPTIADLQERDAYKILKLYRASYTVMVYLSLPMLASLIATIPVMSEWWLGRYEPKFVLFAVLLAIGWFTNVLSAPAYFAGVGTGELRWNLVGHLTLAVLNVCLGIMLGVSWGAVGVVVGAMTALILGSFLIALKYHVQQGLPLKELFPIESARLAMGSLATATTAFVIYHLLRVGKHWDLRLVTAVMALILLPPLTWLVWRHPLRKRLAAWALNLPQRPT
jgi:O-antigen/teichoic acid export membrane protein